MVTRKIIHIDEEKCNGCGLCVSACAEGAIQIRQGKARLVSEVYCDGLGACLGECPQGAITITEREAAAFDEEATRQHLAAMVRTGEPATGGLSQSGHHASHGRDENGTVPLRSAPAGCPGAAARSFSLNVIPSGGLASRPSEAATVAPQANGQPDAESALGHWPVQLRLVPPGAPFLQDADLLLVADCVPFACADFHQRFLRGRPVVIGCPKLDDREFALEKLVAILATSTVRSLTVVHMEVPCCTGLVRIAEAALAACGKSIPLEDVVISVRGKQLGYGNS